MRWLVVCTAVSACVLAYFVLRRRKTPPQLQNRPVPTALAATPQSPALATATTPGDSTDTAAAVAVASVSSIEVPPSKDTKVPSETPKLVSGCFALQGRRPTMEDEHVQIDEMREQFPGEIREAFPQADRIGFYGIFDGHRGIRAAQFLEQNFVGKFIKQDKLREGSVEEAFTQAFIDTDAELLSEARQQPWQDGSTAACALIVDRVLYCANIGDAEIIVGRLNKDTGKIEPVVLSQLHKPDQPDELNRIKAEGGLVFNGRVSGTLAVSRAFGDLEFKTPISDGSIQVGKLVSEVPFVNTFQLDPEVDQFVVVGCDGVWECLSHVDSVQFVAEKLKTESVDAVAERLAKYAIEKGSMDNVSVIVIALHW